MKYIWLCLAHAADAAAAADDDGDGDGDAKSKSYFENLIPRSGPGRPDDFLKVAKFFRK
jgi:hypothetical protein